MRMLDSCAIQTLEKVDLIELDRKEAENPGIRTQMR
jgi:hypothetical protein